MDVSSEYLRDAAVQAVKDYVISKKPLTDSVLAIALRDSLKPEQVKRVVEVVNQVAYLKLLESAKDRTFEFPLASYDDVMAKILSPEEILEEGVTPSPLQLMHKAAEYNEDLVKEASEVDPIFDLSEAQREQMLYSSFMSTKSEIEKLAHTEREMLDSILTLASTCRKDAEFIEKVASLVEGDEDTTKKISKLVFGQVKKASGDELFYEEDLLDAKKMIDMIKTAEALVERKKGLEKSAQQVHGFYTDKAKRINAGAKNVVGSAVKNVGPLNMLMVGSTFKPGGGTVYSNLHPTSHSTPE